ncbi:DUF3889 domain-containing protein [Salirhabdus sp. Marseille-P4669]|uniref:DUF3889 domain-containing protein n=1 Tax=Salirhabdus sp. Marseille-P4669 TaxID=2042310 RepID=UPI000C7A85D0|nr:DUF3889 domain-containing protein [Salirhabdus sp. Marseille-P4669]
MYYYNPNWYRENYYWNSHEAYLPYSNHYYHRQRPVRGQATWTDGGQVTNCGIPWSENQYMTVAVGEQSPFTCGQTIKVRHYTSLGPREVIVTVVDKVRGYPANRLNLHKRAFEALGARPEVGVINIEILSSPELEEEKWGKYLLEVTQVAYPSYNITDYKQVEKKSISANQTQETYEFVLESPDDGQIRVQGNVIYNPNTDRVISFDIKER